MTNVGHKERPFGPQSIVWRFLGLAVTLFFCESLFLLPVFASSTITGSGVLETRTLNISGFNCIRLNHIARQNSRFETYIACGKPYSVSVTLDDNLFRYLDVSLRDNTIVVGLEAPSFYQSIALVVNITLPELDSLDMSTCFAKLDGSNPAKDLDIIMNESSQLWLYHLQTGALNLELLNNSHIFGSCFSDTAVLNMSGGSSAWLWNGTCGTLKATLSGSGAVINQLIARNIDIKLSEDSRASINVTDNLKAILQGMALFQYYGNPASVNIYSNPAATIKVETGQPPSLL